MAAIKSGLQLIPELREDNKDKVTQLISTLNNSAGFMERLINDLLDFSKIQEGNLSLQLKEVSIKKISKEAMEPFLLKAREKAINLSSELPVSDSLIVCDPDRVSRY